MFFVSLNFVSPSCNTWFKKKTKPKLKMFLIIIRPWVLVKGQLWAPKAYLGKQVIKLVAERVESSVGKQLRVINHTSFGVQVLDLFCAG